MALRTVCLLLAASIGALQGVEMVYRGSFGESGLVAISVSVGAAGSGVDAVVAQAGERSVVLVYEDYRNVVRSYPVAVYEHGKRIPSSGRAERITAGTTIGSLMSRAVTTGVRSGATCRDGSHSNATGSGACSHHGGVAQWLTTSAADPSAVVATICSNYLLKAGSGGCPTGTRVLGLISNRRY